MERGHVGNCLQELDQIGTIASKDQKKDLETSTKNNEESVLYDVMKRNFKQDGTKDDSSTSSSVVK